MVGGYAESLSSSAWRVQAGPFKFDVNDGSTDSKGEVQTTLKLGPNEGTFKFIVTTEGEFEGDPDIRLKELSFKATEGPGAGAGSMTVSSPSIVEPRGGTYNGKIGLTFQVKTPAGNPVKGASITVTQVSGVDIHHIPRRPKTNDQGVAALDIQIKTTGSTGGIKLLASVAGSNPEVKTEWSITVKQTPTFLSVSGVPG